LFIVLDNALDNLARIAENLTLVLTI
ncbi:MAG: hypothetical protein RL174_346, partial [Actinomycetota bacterium]